MSGIFFRLTFQPKSVYPLSQRRFRKASKVFKRSKFNLWEIEKLQANDKSFHLHHNRTSIEKFSKFFKLTVDSIISARPRLDQNQLQSKNLGLKNACFTALSKQTSSRIGSIVQRNEHVEDFSMTSLELNLKVGLLRTFENRARIGRSAGSVLRDG